MLLGLLQQSAVATRVEKEGMMKFKCTGRVNQCRCSHCDESIAYGIFRHLACLHYQAICTYKNEAAMVNRQQCSHDQWCNKWQAFRLSPDAPRGWGHCPPHKQLVSAQPTGMGGLVPLHGNAYDEVKAEGSKGEHDCTWRRMELLTLPA